MSIKTISWIAQVPALLLLLSTASISAADERDVMSVVETNFKTADANADGQLDTGEFKSLIDANADSEIGRAATVRRFGAYGRAFSRADQDGDGLVTWSEIVRTRTE